MWPILYLLLFFIFAMASIAGFYQLGKAFRYFKSKLIQIIMVVGLSVILTVMFIFDIETTSYGPWFLGFTFIFLFALGAYTREPAP